jgi:hypothetical protein
MSDYIEQTLHSHCYRFEKKAANMVRVGDCLYLSQSNPAPVTSAIPVGDKIEIVCLHSGENIAGGQCLVGWKYEPSELLLVQVQEPQKASA